MRSNTVVAFLHDFNWETFPQRENKERLKTTDNHPFNLTKHPAKSTVYRLCSPIFTVHRAIPAKQRNKAIKTLKQAGFGHLRAIFTSETKQHSLSTVFKK